MESYVKSCIFVLLVVAWGIGDVVSKPIRNGLLPNGNFEYGPRATQMKGTVVLGTRAIPFWTKKGIVEYISSGHKQGDLLLVVPQGAHAARLGNEAQLSQRIQVKKGAYYTLTFSVARSCAQTEHLNISVPPVAGDLPMQTVYSSIGWDAYAWAFRAAETKVEIILHNPGVEDDPACGPLLDAIAIKELFPPPYIGRNLLKNGDFEEGPLVFRNSSSGVLLPPNVDDESSPLPGWVIESLKAVKYVDAFHYAVPQGRRAVELLAGRESAIAQVTHTVPGKAYVLSFVVGDGSNRCSGSMVVEAFAGMASMRVPYESKGLGGFKRARLPFTASSVKTRVVFFSSFYHMRNDDMSSFCGPVIDDVKLYPLDANVEGPLRFPLRSWSIVVVLSLAFFLI